MIIFLCCCLYLFIGAILTSIFYVINEVFGQELGYYQVRKEEDGWVYVVCPIFYPLVFTVLFGCVVFDFWKIQLNKGVVKLKTIIAKFKNDKD